MTLSTESNHAKWPIQSSLPARRPSAPPRAPFCKARRSLQPLSPCHRIQFRTPRRKCARSRRRPTITSSFRDVLLNGKRRDDPDRVSSPRA